MPLENVNDVKYATHLNKSGTFKTKKTKMNPKLSPFVQYPIEVVQDSLNINYRVVISKKCSNDLDHSVLNSPKGFKTFASYYILSISSKHLTEEQINCLLKSYNNFMCQQYEIKKNSTTTKNVTDNFLTNLKILIIFDQKDHLSFIKIR
ncbi:hypothetical protein MKS88_000847 [Plasmodium brasilianum]|uniref:Uncharacterized protein n=1 Tax=Plasmodium brasilianum TaxID=5824 RepID=A0ACB9YF76_PLABR|nr:hypothetical protein MKS88_000847 [Plasmodium brasilianum]